ncbi:MAG TPA: TerB family tellurite resistance protein [Stellaceae bacterium]|nr:TerB family tellurite resistance protein [Stellaceae bacterium]
MIDSIYRLLSGQLADPATGARHSILVVSAALLVEVANSDQHFDEAERATIARLLEQRFGLSPDEAQGLLVAGKREADRSVEIFHLIRTINEQFSHDERIELIEMLWEVAYADGVLDKFEDTLLRRIGGLLYVSDRERGLARQRVLQRLGIDPAA